MFHQEIYVPNKHTEINPQALTLEEFEALTGSLGFRDRVMNILLHNDAEPLYSIREVKATLSSSGLSPKDICISELPGFRSATSRKRELLDNMLRNAEAMANIGFFLNGDIQTSADISEGNDAIGDFRKSPIARNPKYAWYRRMNEKQRRRNERKKKLNRKNIPRKVDKSNYGTGNKPMNIY